jgi:hypothetical protein
MMDLVSIVLGAVVFAAFVPGVLVRLPPRASKTTVLLVHAVLFAVTSTLVMKWYWSMKEHMGNYGTECPNGYVPGKNQAGEDDCVPSGHLTYDPSMQLKTKTD